MLRPVRHELLGFTERARQHAADLGPGVPSRENPIDSQVSCVATVWPRCSASTIRARVSNGNLTCT
jgi:hypothetical protein